MDLSKLPGRQSESPPTPALPPNAPPAQGSTPPSPPLPAAEPPIARRATYDDRADDDTTPIDGYFALGIGLIILYLAPRFLLWVRHALFGTPFPPFNMPDGTIDPYPTIVAFSDLAITLFAMALIFEGAILMSHFRRNGPAVLCAALFTGLATAANAAYVVAAFGQGVLLSLIAVLFGGYSTLHLYRRGTALLARRRPAAPTP